jgi:hypothetical protein
VDRLGGWLRRHRPELAKVESLISMKLLQAELFLAEPNSYRHGGDVQVGAQTGERHDETRHNDLKDNPPIPRNAHEILQQMLTKPSSLYSSLDEAHQRNHELNQLLPLIASDGYLYATLESESKKVERDPEHRILITDLIDQQEIREVLNRQRRRLRVATNEREPTPESKAQDRGRAEQFLAKLYEARDERWRYERALARLRRRCMLFYAVGIGILLASLGSVINSTNGQLEQLRDQLLTVALAGALGSTLAALVKLRDAVVRLNDLLAIAWVMGAQALIGASFGLVAWLFLRSGVVQIGNASLEGYALLAFASGFSEPLSLRLIGRFIDGV